ncbi:MAG: sugar phosphate isomerase/epimerase [Chloroflexota bacterium]|nr:sugar phosphate isomerase/epimerase [Chloroflexota bacterium]
MPAYPLEETIKRLARIGYDGIEIGAAAPHAYPEYLSKERRQELRKVLDDNGIAVSAMLPAPGGGPGFNVASPLAEERRSAVEQYKQVAQLCADLGSQTLLYVAGWQIFGTEREQAFTWSRDALAEIETSAADVGVTVAVEPTPTDSNLIESADDAIELMRAFGAPNVKLMCDTIHVLYRNEVPTDYVYRMGKDLHYVHLSELDRLPPGQGRADFVGLVDALKEVAYDGYLSMEIGFNRRDVEADLVARQAYEYMKPLVDG